ncbi:MAG: hypothetical protein HC828_17450 [Blastochloris sp.]|nr:hypothetical protein [Blastochloris sp.]
MEEQLAETVVVGDIATYHQVVVEGGILVVFGIDTRVLVGHYIDKVADVFLAFAVSIEQLHEVILRLHHLLAKAKLLAVGLFSGLLRLLSKFDKQAIGTLCRKEPFYLCALGHGEVAYVFDFFFVFAQIGRIAERYAETVEAGALTERERVGR